MQDEGYIAKIFYPDGTKDIPVGAPICILVEEEEDVKKFADFVLDDAPAAAAPAAAPASQEAAPEAPQASATPASQSSSAPKDGRIVASPLAHKLAAEQGVSLSGI